MIPADHAIATNKSKPVQKFAIFSRQFGQFSSFARTPVVAGYVLFGRQQR
jgi:hypothetical protein